MPYDSDAQRKYFHVAMSKGDIKPSVVKEFDKASKGKKLPDHVKKMAEGGMVCMGCGGDVDEDGSPMAMALGADENDYDKDNDGTTIQSSDDDDKLHKALFAKALRKMT